MHHHFPNTSESITVLYLQVIMVLINSISAYSAVFLSSVGADGALKTLDRSRIAGKHTSQLQDA